MLLKAKKKIIGTNDCLWTSMHYTVSFLSKSIFRTLPIVWLIKKKKVHCVGSTYVYALDISSS